VTHTATDLCVQTHRTDPERPRPALDGLRLCHGHHNELECLIAELPARHNDLDRPKRPGGPKISFSNDPGLNIDETAANLRAQIQHDLLWWAIYVADQRGLNRPRNANPSTTAAWLTRHTTWLAADPHAAETLLPVLRELTGKAIGITDIPARRVQLGEQCLVHTDGDRCTGEITIIIRGDEWIARCSECVGDQEATQYLRIAQRGQWVTADGVIRLANLFGITASPDVVRQWKHRRHIRGIVGDVENLYDLESVQRYLVKRQTERERVSA
jgi:hypothetical protein